MTAQRNDLGEDLEGFEITYPDGRTTFLTADGKEEI